MATKYAYIPEIKNGVVFSDPWYNESVWCQYRADFSAKNWLMKMETQLSEGIVFFNLYLGRPTMVSSTSAIEEANGSMKILFPSRYTNKDVEIGMDTACVFCGAKEYFSEEGAIHTGTDGLFGELMVFTNQGEKDPAGFLLMGAIDEMFASEEQLFDHICSSFDGNKIPPQIYAQKTDPYSLEFKTLLSQEAQNAKKAKRENPPTRKNDAPER